jgi:hypothetical protein
MEKINVFLYLAGNISRLTTDPQILVPRQFQESCHETCEILASRVGRETCKLCIGHAKNKPVDER